jgi:proline iminopeptidase
MSERFLFGEEHVRRYQETDGDEGYEWREGSHILLLTTTGRRTGQEHTTPLIFGLEGDNPVIVASKGGAPQHPGWYRNLIAHPEVEVQVGTKKLRARARTATGEERTRLWQKALEFWPPYADYQTKTEREIPVVVLDPVR